MMLTDSEEKFLHSLSTAPTKENLDAIFDSLSNLYDYIDQHICPILAGQISINNRERAFLEIFTRIKLLVKGIIKLNDLYCFQSAASTVRSIFELYIDLHILEKDTNGRLLQQYNNYPIVERFRSAYFVAKFDAEHPEEKSDEIAKWITTHTYKKEDIIKVIIENWGKALNNKGEIIFPKHWTNKSKKALAKELGPYFEKLYLDIYPKLSWFVHSDPTGYQRMNDFNNIVLLQYIYLLTQQLFDDSTFICAREFKITQYDQQFKNRLLLVRTEYFKNIIALAKKNSSSGLIKQ